MLSSVLKLQTLPGQLIKVDPFGGLLLARLEQKKTSVLLLFMASDFDCKLLAQRDLFELGLEKNSEVSFRTGNGHLH